jgi:hypothetical protein
VEQGSDGLAVLGEVPLGAEEPACNLHSSHEQEREPAFEICDEAHWQIKPQSGAEVLVQLVVVVSLVSDHAE